MTPRFAHGPNSVDPQCPALELSASDPERSAIWQGSSAMQRATMRALRDKLGDDPDVICAAYVEAERANSLSRAGGVEDMASPLHARMLWREGTLKGWIRS